MHACTYPQLTLLSRVMDASVPVVATRGAMAAKSFTEQDLHLYRLSSKAAWSFTNAHDQREFERQLSVTLSNQHRSVVIALTSEKGSIWLDVLANAQVWSGIATVLACGIKYDVMPVAVPDAARTTLLWALGHLAKQLDPEVARATQEAFEIVVKGFKAWQQLQGDRIATADAARARWEKERKPVAKAVDRKRKAAAAASTKAKSAKKKKSGDEPAAAASKPRVKTEDEPMTKQ